MQLSESLASNVVPIGHATGPRTERGKQIASRNALSHGLYSSATVLRHLEDQGEFERFARSILADLGVETALQMACAERLISALWRQRRVRRYETAALSAKADVAAELAAKRDEARKQASKLMRWADAVQQISFSPSVARAVADDADCGVQRYIDDVEQDKWMFILDRRGESSQHRTVTRRRFYAAVERLRKELPPDIACSSRDDFIFTCHYHLHVRSTAFSAEADKIDRKVQEESKEALFSLPWLHREVADAEGKLDRQITRYIADLASIGIDVLQPSRRRGERIVS